MTVALFRRTLSRHPGASSDGTVDQQPLKITGQRLKSATATHVAKLVRAIALFAQEIDGISAAKRQLNVGNAKLSR